MIDLLKSGLLGLAWQTGFTTLIYLLVAVWVWKETGKTPWNLK